MPTNPFNASRLIVQLFSLSKSKTTPVIGTYLVQYSAKSRSHDVSHPVTYFKSGLKNVFKIINVAYTHRWTIVGSFGFVYDDNGRKILELYF